MSPKLLLALQYWEGDREAAYRLARTLADLEPKHSESADLLLVHRADCVPPDKDLIAYLSRKFNVFVYRSPRRTAGWPAGCNDLWFATIEWVWSMLDARKIQAYSSVFTFEADGAPLVEGWIEKFQEAWGSAKVKVLGCEVDNKKCPKHVNGNAMFSCDLNFLYWLAREIGAVGRGAWDVALYPEFAKRGAADFPGLRSYYQTRSVTGEWVAQEQSKGTVFVHGVKDGSLLREVRARFRLPPL